MINFDETKNKMMLTWIISILIILNIIAFIFINNLLFFRIDMTEGKAYSISKPTIELLRKIDNQNPLIIEYYYSDKCREIAWMSQVVQYINDMLIEYQNSSRGLVNVIIKQLNYEKDKAEIDSLETLGIQGFQLREREETESKTLLGYSGILIKYKDNQRVIPVVYMDAGFEYTLDTEIKKLVETEGNKIGFIIGANDKNLENNYKEAYDLLVKEYSTIQEVKPGSRILNDIGVLIIVGGGLLNDFDIFQIDQFLMNGGKAVIALSGIKLMFSQQYGAMAFPNDSKLFDLLDFYGIKINKDLVGDNESYTPIPQRRGFFIQEFRYPIWPRIKKTNFSQSSLIVKELRSLNLFWPSSIDIDDKIKDKTELIFRTTKESWHETKNFNIDLDTYTYPTQKSEKEFNLAYTFKGRLASYYENKEIPQEIKNNKEFSGNITQSGETQLVVIGNETLFDSNYMQENEKVFFLNTVDWLSKDFSLMLIRDKGKFSRPLDKSLKQEMPFKINFIIGFSTYAVPILIIALAIILYILKKSKTYEIKEKYKK